MIVLFASIPIYKWTQDGFCTKFFDSMHLVNTIFYKRDSIYGKT